MPQLIERQASYLAEAARCERVSWGMSDGILVRQLLDWAEDYRRKAQDLARIVDVIRVEGHA